MIVLGAYTLVEELSRAFVCDTLELIADVFEAGRWQVDLHSKEMSWDERMFELHGYSGSGHPGAQQELLSLVLPSEIKDVIHAWSNLLNGDGTCDVEYSINVSEGEVRRLRSVGRVFEVEGARKLCGVSFDVTERHELKRSLIQAQKMESLGHLTVGITHDFNNILAALFNYIDLLELDAPEREGIADTIEGLRGVAERGARLTQQILAFARKSTREPEVVDLGECVERTVELLAHIIGRGVELRYVASEGPVFVCVDDNQLEQVLINLATNARDAMPGGGVISFEVGTRQLEEVTRAHERVLSPGEYAVVSVRDTGTGVSADLEERIFEPFFTTKPRQRGTGLGLSTAVEILQRFEGGLFLERAPGQGACFTVALPPRASPRGAPR